MRRTMEDGRTPVSAKMSLRAGINRWELYTLQTKTPRVVFGYQLPGVYPMNLAQVTTLNEEQARDYLESIRWPNRPVCPHCASQAVVKLQGKSTRPGVYKCKNKDCRKQFTVTVGTIFERSHIPLRHWVIAFHMMASSKKGVSAHQIHRSVGCTYKSAWFMCHRIRHAMEQGPVDGPKLSGTVEVDETYVGGKPRGGAKGRVGRGTKKAPVVALVQRDGEVRTIAVNRVTASNLSKHVEKYVDPKSRLITDEFKSYTKLGWTFPRMVGAHKRAYLQA
jgi:transposase-like protein